MKIGIDARFITRQPRRGIGNYSLNLIRELVRLDSKIKYILYIADPDIEGVLPNLPNVIIKRLWPSTYPVWENISLPLAAMRDGIDILHCLGNTAPLFLFPSTQLIVSLHDVMFLQKNNIVPIPTTLYQKWGRLYRGMVVPVVARLAKKVITISEFSHQDILQSIQKLNSKKLVVIYESCDAIFNSEYPATNTSRCESELLNDQYILCLGAEDPRKNTLRLVHVYLKLLEKNIISENLIICGYSNWENSASYQAVKDAGAEKRVIFFGFITTKKLRDLYEKAVVFAYPSLYEGFGIPMLEAFSSGCPVIASNVTSIPEVGGDAALYFDPFNEAEISEILLRVLNNKLLREDLRKKGFERAAEFSWKKTAQQTLEVYKEVMKQLK